jgi:hypothetical protein
MRNSTEEVIRVISARAAESHERSETFELSPQKETKTLISRTLPRLSIGAEPKSASSIDQRRSPLRCVWIPTSLHGSKPMAAVTRPKRIGCCDTPCFTTREEKVLASVQAPAGRPRNRKERLDHAEPVPARGATLTRLKCPLLCFGSQASRRRIREMARLRKGCRQWPKELRSRTARQCLR